MPTHSTTHHSFDRDIINRLRQNGIDRKKGEEQLFSSYAYFIEQAMHTFSFAEDEAFNIYVDTILAAIIQITNGHFEGRASLKTWLHQIFHNKCVDFVRKKATNKGRVHRSIAITNDMMHQLADPAKTAIQEIMEKTNWDMLQLRLKELGENCRRLLMRWSEGYTDKELASEMDYKSADVVKTSRLRCMEKLKQLYKGKQNSQQ